MTESENYFGKAPPKQWIWKRTPNGTPIGSGTPMLTPLEEKKRGRVGLGLNIGMDGKDQDVVGKQEMEAGGGLEEERAQEVDAMTVSRWQPPPSSPLKPKPIQHPSPFDGTTSSTASRANSNSSACSSPNWNAEAYALDEEGDDIMLNEVNSSRYHNLDDYDDDDGDDDGDRNNEGTYDIDDDKSERKVPSISSSRSVSPKATRRPSILSTTVVSATSIKPTTFTMDKEAAEEIISKKIQKAMETPGPGPGLSESNCSKDEDRDLEDEEIKEEEEEAEEETGSPGPSLIDDYYLDDTTDNSNSSSLADFENDEQQDEQKYQEGQEQQDHLFQSHHHHHHKYTDDDAYAYAYDFDDYEPSHDHHYDHDHLDNDSSSYNSFLNQNSYYYDEDEDEDQDQDQDQGKQQNPQKQQEEAEESENSEKEQQEEEEEEKEEEEEEKEEEEEEEGHVGTVENGNRHGNEHGNENLNRKRGNGNGKEEKEKEEEEIMIKIGLEGFGLPLNGID